MARIMSYHEFELLPGVTEEQFERFIKDEYVPLLSHGRGLPGWKVYFLKGNRGVRDGKYAVVWEIDSKENRDHYFPRKNGPSPEWHQAVEQLSQAQKTAFFDKYGTFATPSGETFTDYEVIAE